MIDFHLRGSGFGSWLYGLSLNVWIRLWIQKPSLTGFVYWLNWSTVTDWTGPHVEEQDNMHTCIISAPPLSAKNTHIPIWLQVGNDECQHAMIGWCCQPRSDTKWLQFGQCRQITLICYIRRKTDRIYRLADLERPSLGLLPLNVAYITDNRDLNNLWSRQFGAHFTDAIHVDVSLSCLQQLWRLDDRIECLLNAGVLHFLVAEPLLQVA